MKKKKLEQWIKNMNFSTTFWNIKIISFPLCLVFIYRSQHALAKDQKQSNQHMPLSDVVDNQGEERCQESIWSGAFRVFKHEIGTW